MQRIWKQILCRQKHRMRSIKNGYWKQGSDIALEILTAPVLYVNTREQLLLFFFFYQANIRIVIALLIINYK